MDFTENTAIDETGVLALTPQKLLASVSEFLETTPSPEDQQKVSGYLSKLAFAKFDVDGHCTRAKIALDQAIEGLRATMEQDGQRVTEAGLERLKRTHESTTQLYQDFHYLAATLRLIQDLQDAIRVRARIITVIH